MLDRAGPLEILWSSELDSLEVEGAESCTNESSFDSFPLPLPVSPVLGRAEPRTTVSLFDLGNVEVEGAASWWASSPSESEYEYSISTGCFVQQERLGLLGIVGAG